MIPTWLPILSGAAGTRIKQKPKANVWLITASLKPSPSSYPTHSKPYLGWCLKPCWSTTCQLQGSARQKPRPELKSTHWGEVFTSRFTCFGSSSATAGFRCTTRPRLRPDQGQRPRNSVLVHRCEPSDLLGRSPARSLAQLIRYILARR